MNTLWKSKLKAFSIHLLLSVLLIATFMWVVTQLWYPGLLFKLENVWQGLQILIPVDATLGPLLTLILFVPGKKGLVGDLSIIATIQVLALVGGGFAIYQSRPEVIVFTGDRFEVVTAFKYDRDNLNNEYFTQQQPTYPFIVYALPAQNDEERSHFVLNNVQYQKLSERYRPLDNYRDLLSEKSLKAANFKPSSESAKTLFAEFKNSYKKDVFLFVLEGTTATSRIIILDKQSLQLRGFLDIDPWQNYLNK